MQHLSLEALSRLVDEPPAPEEARHVRDCLVCRRELEALRETTALLGEMEDAEPPAAGWLDLEARLEREGLIRAPASGGAPRAAYPAWMRYAAALVLFAGGGVTGVAVWGRGEGTRTPAGPAVLPPVAVRGTPAPGGAAPVGPLPPLATETAAGAPEAGGVRFAAQGDDPVPARAGSGTTRPAPAPRPAPANRELARAEAELRDVQAQFLAVLQRYAALADERSGADPATRLAALDRLLQLTGAALERTPEDPVVNGYHLAALRARATLRAETGAAGGAEWF